MKEKSRKRNTILESISRIKRTNSAFNLTQIQAFLYIAENPGVNIGELAELCGLQSSSASRVVRSLTSIDEEGSLTPHLGLIQTIPNPFDSRERFLALTEAGEQLCQNLDVVITKSILIASTSAEFKRGLNEISVGANKAPYQL